MPQKKGEVMKSFLKDKRWWAQSCALLLLFALVFAARLWYVEDISIVKNQHDTSRFDKEGNYGHTGYIMYLLEENQLPDFDVRGKSQFYHPPLHHYTCAQVLKLQLYFGVDFADACENLQYLTLFYSMVALFAVWQILRALKVGFFPTIAALTVIGFHPTSFLLAGSINNDCMSLMFVLLAVWVTILWTQKPTFVRIVALAFCIGLAMAAKLAAGVVAPAVALVFLYKLIMGIREGKSYKRLLVQFAVFGVICIPLGIGWQVRNYVMYGVPLLYVPKLSVKADQYLGMYSAAERFFDWKSLADFGVYPMRTGVQGATYFEHCIPLALLKMALFGEYSVWKDIPSYDVAGNLCFVLQAILILLSFVGVILAVVRFIKRCKAREPITAKWVSLIFLLIYAVTMLYSYATFCFSYPHFCSMDFRYVVPLLMVGCVFLAYYLHALHKHIGQVANKAAKGALIAVAVLSYAAVLAFAATSVYLYPVYFM